MSEDRATPPHGLIDRVGDAISHICLAIAAVSLLCIVAINGLNVAARYVFNKPFSWGEELMLFLMILSVFAGAIAVTWRNMHIRIDTFIERAPPAARRVAMVVGSLVAIGALVTVAHTSARVAMLLYGFDQRSDALNAPSWIPQSFVAIGLGTISLMMAIKLVQALMRAPTPTPEDRP